MNKKHYVEITKEKLANEKSKMIMINQIERFYNYEENYLNVLYYLKFYLKHSRSLSFS